MHLVEALPLESRIADCEDFVHDQDVRLQMGRFQEASDDIDGLPAKRDRGRQSEIALDVQLMLGLLLYLVLSTPEYQLS